MTKNRESRKHALSPGLSPTDASPCLLTGELARRRCARAINTRPPPTPPPPNSAPTRTTAARSARGDTHLARARHVPAPAAAPCAAAPPPARHASRANTRATAPPARPATRPPPAGTPPPTARPSAPATAPKRPATPQVLTHLRQHPRIVHRRRLEERDHARPPLAAGQQREHLRPRVPLPCDPVKPQQSPARQDERPRQRVPRLPRHTGPLVQQRPHQHLPRRVPTPVRQGPDFRREVVRETHDHGTTTSFPQDAIPRTL
jgi:hypothetical protein